MSLYSMRLLFKPSWVVNEEILQDFHGGLAGVPGLADDLVVEVDAKERIIMAWRLAVPG